MPDAPTLTLWDQFQAGGLTMYILVLLSVAGLAAAFERFVNFRPSRILSLDFAREADRLWQAGAFDQLAERCQKHDSVLARSVAAIVRYRDMPYRDVNLAVGEIASSAIKEHLQRTYVLSIVATRGPRRGRNFEGAHDHRGRAAGGHPGTGAAALLHVAHPEGRHRPRGHHQRADAPLVSEAGGVPMKIDLPSQEGDDINLAPLIDCVFLLLIFFMVATTFDRAQPATEDPVEELLIDLPDASAAIETDGLPAPVVITVDSRGRYTIGGERVGVQRLHEKLKALAATDPHRRLRIDGDRNVAYQYVAHVLDVCQFVGLENIGARMR